MTNDKYFTNAISVEHTTQNNPTRVPTIVEKDKGLSRTDGPPRRDSNKQSIMEKQVRVEFILYF